MPWDMLYCTDERLLSLSFSLTKVGGSLGIVTGMIAYYIALAELLAAEKFQLFNLPLGAFDAD